MAEVWNDTHRAFLQCLLSRQTITFEEAQPLLAAIQTANEPDRPTLTGDISEEDFEDYINAVSNRISHFDLEVRNAIHQKSNTRVYALVNTTSDALTQMATSYSPDEIAFVRRVLEAMFDTFNTREAEIMAVTSMQAMRLAKAPRENRRDSGNDAQSGPIITSLTGNQAEKVLETLTAQGWFEHNSRTGFYSLTPRALMELKDWLVQTFNRDEEDDVDDEDDDERDDYQRIKMCGGCGDIVTVGQRCPNLDCMVRVHEHCANNFFRSHGNTQECPGCKTCWQGAPRVGEKAARRISGQARAGAGRSSTGGGRRGRSSVGIDGADDHEDATSGAEDYD